MPPKKAAEPPPAPEPVSEVEEEPVEPEILKRCVRAGGQLYHGECKAGYKERKGTFLRHGTGQQVSSAVTPAGCRFSDNLAYETVITGIYEGSWEEDAMSGQGSYKWCDGCSYEGNFVNGMMNGHGIFVWPDGSSYRGSWQMGTMHGQGRFDSRYDGRFLQGRFHRNCFQNKDKRWVDVLGELQQEEVARVREGDPSSLQVRRCAFGEAYADNQRSQVMEEQSQAIESMITSIQHEGLVPLVVAEESLGGPALDCLGRAGLLPDRTLQCASVRLAALAKRRKRDHHRFFHDPILHSLQKGVLFVLVFEDDSDSISLDRDEEQQESWYNQRPQHGDHGGPLPEDWRLAHFFRPSVLPVEVFKPTLFNGRCMSRHFLPEDSVEAFGTHLPGVVAALPAAIPAPGSAEAAPAPTGNAESEVDRAASEAASAVAVAAAAKTPDGRLGLSGHFFEPSGMAPKAAGLQVMHCLRPAIATKAYLPSGLSDAEVRESILQKFHRHVPLHQTVVVLVSKKGVVEDVEPSN